MKHTTSLRTASLVAIFFAAAVPAQAGTIFVNHAATGILNVNSGADRV